MTDIDWGEVTANQEFLATPSLWVAEEAPSPNTLMADLELQDNEFLVFSISQYFPRARADFFLLALNRLFLVRG